MNFKQPLTIISLILFTVACLSGCDRYESDLNRIMRYDKANKIRLFLPIEKKKDGRYIPKYLEIKYVDQNRVLTELDIERKEELITYLSKSWHWYQPDIVEKVEKSPLKKEDESEEEYKSRIFGLIPEVKSGREVYRTKEDIEKEVWNLFRVGEVAQKTGNSDFLFWVTYLKTALNQGDQIDFSIVLNGRTQKLEKILIKDGDRGSSFELGFESSFTLSKRHYLLVCKNFKPELKKRYSLEIKGAYMAKKGFEFDNNHSSEYNEWDTKEIWWKIDRQIDFYIDEAGNCHFENERYLIDETLNPSVNFHSNRPREMLPAN